MKILKLFILMAFTVAFAFISFDALAECKCANIYTPCAPCEGVMRKVVELDCKPTWCGNCCSGIHAPDAKNIKSLQTRLRYEGSVDINEFPYISQMTKINNCHASISTGSLQK
jgi:hypothetical protein